MRSLADHSQCVILEDNERNKIKILLRLWCLCDIIKQKARMNYMLGGFLWLNTVMRLRF